MDSLPTGQPGLIARFLIAIVRLYQVVLSPLLGPVCRFHPSCSRYTAECLRLHGAFRGSYLGAYRILRCHPFHPGGYDPPPLPKAPVEAPRRSTEDPSASNARNRFEAQGERC